MRASIFAAIYIGSYDVTLELFEISRKNGIRTVEKIGKHFEIGTETYLTGKISTERVMELCAILKDLLRIVNGYQAEAVRTIAASAIREAENCPFVIEKIRQQTGLKVENMSNSEQRFLNFKAIACSDPKFHTLIEEGTAIIDVSGGSIQISFFSGGNLSTTLNLRIGSLRTRDRLRHLKADHSRYKQLVEEFISHELHTFRTIQLSEQRPKSVILNGDFITETLFKDAPVEALHSITKEKFESWFSSIIKGTELQLSEQLHIPAESESLIKPTAILYHKFIEEIGAEEIYASEVTLSNGMAYEFAEGKKVFRAAHTFEDDILTAADQLAKRYAVDEIHVENVEMLAMEIFRAIRKTSGMKERDRLLLRIIARLHEVGKYISLNDNGNCAYHIIMHNEIIGLAHKERELIAIAAKFNTVRFPEYEEMVEMHGIGLSRYLKVAQLTAILRVANELDRSHRQKIKNIRCVCKDNALTIRVKVDRDFTLERGLVEEHIRFLKQIFNLDVALKVQRL